MRGRGRSGRVREVDTLHAHDHGREGGVSPPLAPLPSLPPAYLVSPSSSPLSPPSLRLATTLSFIVPLTLPLLSMSVPPRPTFSLSLSLSLSFSLFLSLHASITPFPVVPGLHSFHTRRHNNTILWTPSPPLPTPPPPLPPSPSVMRFCCIAFSNFHILHTGMETDERYAYLKLGMGKKYPATLFPQKVDLFLACHKEMLCCSIKGISMLEKCI